MKTDSPVRLKDIAEATSLSIGAVSQLLNRDDPRYPEATRLRVREVAAQLGYRPHWQAQSLRNGKSRLIGVLNFTEGRSMALRKLLKLSTRLEEQGYQLLTNDIFSPQRARTVVRLMLDLRVDALIVKSMRHWMPPEILKDVIAAGIPVVNMDGAKMRGVPRFRPEKARGMAQLVRHLAGLGHRRLLLVVRPMDEREILGRPPYSHPGELKKGFRAAIRELRSDFPITGNIVEEAYPGTPQDEPDPSFYRGKIAMERLLHRGSLPDALLCNNDGWAMGALAACHEAGVRVPDDLAITGFDNDPIGKYTSVPLTTVAQPLDELAAAVFNALQQTLDGKRLSGKEDHIVGPCRLIVRASCGAARQKSKS